MTDKNDQKTAQFGSLISKAKKGVDGFGHKDKPVVSIENLVVEQGFNVRGIGLSLDEYLEQPHVIEHIEGLAQSYTNGDYVPPIVVKFDKESGKAVIRDGWHRYKALLLCIERGVPIQKVEVAEIKGDEATQQILMLQSANQLELTPVERAEIIHRLHSYGFDEKEIAQKIRKSVTYVADMMKIYDLPLEIKKKIQKKEISYATALKDERKANPKKAKKATPPKKLVMEMMEILSGTVSFDTQPDQDGFIQVSLPYELVSQFLESKSEDELKIDDKTGDFFS